MAITACENQESCTDGNNRMAVIHPPQVLVSSPYYVPGFRAGGALRAVANLVSQLGRKIDFKIITRDRDAFSDLPYDGITRETWLKINDAQVYYVDRSKLSFGCWHKLLNNEQYDVLYLNSLFSFWFSIKPAILARFGLLRSSRILLAPRGELSLGALGLKSRKKRLFLALARHTGLYQGVTFQASSQYERADIARIFGNRVRIVVAADIPAPPPSTSRPKRKGKADLARFLFLGRIAPVKNLKGALLTLINCKQECELRIVGPIDDEMYWKECQELIDHMPRVIRVEYMGEIDNGKLDDVFSVNHFLLLPSLSENFGHAIYESLARGTPVLVGDKTPWRDLQAKGIGWDIPLENEKAWEEAVSSCISMTAEKYEAMSTLCMEHARMFATDSSLFGQNYDLFAAFKPSPTKL